MNFVKFMEEFEKKAGLKSPYYLVKYKGKLTKEMLVDVIYNPWNIKGKDKQQDINKQTELGRLVNKDDED